MGAFLTLCLPIEFALKTMLTRVFERNFFFTICNLFVALHKVKNVTGKVRIIKTFTICGFSGKIDGFFSKKTLKTFQIAKSCNFFLDWVSNGNNA